MEEYVGQVITEGRKAPHSVVRHEGEGEERPVVFNGGRGFLDQECGVEVERCEVGFGFDYERRVVPDEFVVERRNKDCKRDGE